MADQATKSSEETARLAAIQRAMMDDIGIQRLDELPMEDGERDRGPHRRDHNVGNHRSHVIHPTARVNNPGVGSIWNTAIASGVFDDDDAEAVKGLDDFGGGRLYAAKAAATRVLQQIQPNRIAVRFNNPFHDNGPEDAAVVICHENPSDEGVFKLLIGDSVYFGWSLRLWHNYAIDEENLELMIQFKNDQGAILTYSIRFLSYKDIMQVIGTVRSLRIGHRMAALKGAPTSTGPTIAQAPLATRPSTPRAAPISKKDPVPSRATVTNGASGPSNESNARTAATAPTAHVATEVTAFGPQISTDRIRTVENAPMAVASASDTGSTLTPGPKSTEHTEQLPEPLPRESGLAQQSTEGPGETGASHGISGGSAEPQIPGQPSTNQSEDLEDLIDLNAVDPEVTADEVPLPSASEELSTLDPLEYPALEPAPPGETGNTESHGRFEDTVVPPSEARAPQTMQSLQENVLSLARNLLKVWSLAGKSGENMMQAAQTAEGIKQALFEHVLSLNESESPEVKQAIEQMFEDILPSQSSASVKSSQDIPSTQQGQPLTSAEPSQVATSAEPIQHPAAPEQEGSTELDVGDYASGARGRTRYSREDLLSLKQFAKPPAPGSIKNTPICRGPSPHRSEYDLSAEKSRAQISKSVTGFSWVSGGEDTSASAPELKAQNASVANHDSTGHDRKMDVGHKTLNVPDSHLGSSATNKSKNTGLSGLKQSLWATPDVEIKNANFFTGPAYKKAWPKNSYCYELSQLNPHDRIDAPADEVANFYFSGPSTHSEQRDFAMGGAVSLHLAKTNSLGPHSGTHAGSSPVANTDASVGSNLDPSAAEFAPSSIVSHVGSSTARVEDLSRRFSGLSLASRNNGQSPQPPEKTVSQSTVPIQSVTGIERVHEPAAAEASTVAAQQTQPRDPMIGVHEKKQPVLRGLGASRHSAPETAPVNVGKFTWVRPTI
ncbi:hypothetical protein B0T19DRAFT_461759 [Cercophora scortea]|uniref:Uncharacterized protein n=1 Tax=Cercophora scortea TaxID=314031 RepID=A0AAE0MEP8_9PEZI|nr:hypothetical protein B0T19DRAFT_461759 [Cercophora scortea]